VLYDSARGLAKDQLPEMLRAPLEQLCLRIKVLGLGQIAHFLSKAIEPPSPQAIEHVINILREFNALEKKEEILTPLGYHLASLPVSTQPTSLIHVPNLT
jgi:HrpA-like RNA helicase